MVKNHLKNIAMPKEWPIKRKEKKYIVRPKPGPHTLREGMPMSVVLREVLNFAKTRKDVRAILSHKLVLVDGRRRKDPRFIVGLMDVLAIPEIEEYYRVLLNEKGKIDFIKVDADDSQIKPCKIIGKKNVVGGKTQVNLFDGKNIILDKDNYSVRDTLLIDFQGAVRDHLKFEVGNLIFLTGGKNKGSVGKLDAIEGEKIIVTKDKTTFETSKDYAFVIGKKEPCIKIIAKKEKK